MNDLSGKIMLITGSNTGIGKATALELAKCGARVILHGRDSQKGEKARAEIKAKSGNENVDLILADLSEQTHIFRMVEQIRQTYSHLDVLLNNAAIVPRKRTFNSVGVEMQFAVNHLAYFVLSHALLDMLKASPQGRIINTSSKLHQQGEIQFDNLQGEKSYSEFGWRQYCNTKLMNVAFTLEMAERLAGTSVTINAVHPGLINTELARDFSLLIAPIKWLTFDAPIQGTKTPIYAATSPDLATLTGKYFERQKIAAHNPIADDPLIRAKLWEISANITGTVL